MKILKENGFALSVLAAMAAASAYFYPSLPASMPSKFDFNGNPTQYSSKEFITLFMPLIFLFTIGLVEGLVKASPKEFSMPRSRKAVDVILGGSGLLLGGVHLGMMLDPSGRDVFVRSFSFGIALFLIVVGNVFGKTERNFVMGIRLPWSMASEANWRATHRLAGKLMVTVGCVLLPVTFFYSSLILALVAILVPTTAPVVYSYYYFKTHEQSQMDARDDGRGG